MKPKRDLRPSDSAIVDQIGGVRLIAPKSRELFMYAEGLVAALNWCRWAGEGYIPPVEIFKVAQEMHGAGKRAARRRT